MNSADMLQDLGYTVIEAATAEEAMTALQTTAVDVLVTDVNLPGQSGTDLAAHAREARPEIGVVFATGASDIAFATTGRRVRTLSKPYSAATLGEAVNSAAGMGREGEGLAAAEEG